MLQLLRLAHSGVTCRSLTPSTSELVSLVSYQDARIQGGASSSGPCAETLLPPAAVGRAQRRCSRTAVRSLRSYSCASSGGTLPPLTHSEVILTAAMSPPHRSPAGRAFAPEWELPPLHPLHKAKNLPLFRNQTCPCSIGSNNRRWGWRGGGSKRTFVEARLEKVGNKNLTLILDFCL